MNSSVCVFFVFQTCDIKAEGRKRFLTLKNVQLDQAGEVSYQALNAVTSAMLTVKGNPSHISHTYTDNTRSGCVLCVPSCCVCWLNVKRHVVRKVMAVCLLS